MKIIVSYRRSDSSATAGRIYDHLLQQFGQRSVFMDVDAIPFGTDFRSHIRDALLGSDVLLAIIGPSWFGAQPDGSRRIDDEADPVRVEVETALTNGLTVVPVLIDGTPMPGANQLPPALKELAFLNAAPVDMGRDFRLHVDRLAKAIEAILAARQPEAGEPASIPPPVVSPRTAGRSNGALLTGGAVLIVAALLGAGGWFVVGGRSAAGVAPAPSAPSRTRPVAEAPSAPAVPSPEMPVKAAELPPTSPAAPPPSIQVPPQTPVAANPLPPAPTVATRPATTNRSPAHGTFAWYELWTTDQDAARTFYRSVIGWEAKTTGSGAGAYTSFSAGPALVAGLATLPAAVVGQGVRPGWTGYVTVSDVDASAAQAREAGGAIYLGPADIPGIGRYALVADPQGGTIALFKGLVDPPPTTADVPPGHAGWRELRTGDREAANAFYARLFGWSRTGGDDAGLMARGETTIAAVKPLPAGGGMPAWTFAFHVPNLTAAMGRVGAGGGKVVGTIESLTGDYWSVRCVDPQGAAFALMSRTR